MTINNFFDTGKNAQSKYNIKRRSCSWYKKKWFKILKTLFDWDFFQVVVGFLETK
jgi:hypothetical protein